MGKGDSPMYYLDIQLTPKVFAVIDNTHGDVYYTNSDGYVRIPHKKGIVRLFTITADGFVPYTFEYKFESPLVEMSIVLVPVEIPIPPIDDNVLHTDIDLRYAILNENWFRNAILIQGRTIKYQWGNPDALEDNLASVVRSWVNLIWGSFITDNGMDWLDKWCEELPGFTSKTINKDMAVSNLLSYTTPHTWVYSGGKDNDGIARWPKQFSIINELYGKPANEVIQEKIFDKLTGSYHAWMISDGTMRIGSTIRDLYKLARLLFNKGRWNNVQIIDERYVERTLAGGPNGNGVPFPLEGYQTHLIRDGSAWEMENALPGVPDGFMARSSKSYIIGIPSLELIMCGHGPEQLQSVFLPQVCNLMRM